MATIDWLTLSLTQGIGPILAERLVAAAGGARDACAADIDLLRRVDGIGTNGATKIFNALRAARNEAAAEMSRVEAAGIDLVCPDDDAYPFLLRSIPSPPMVLYVKGALQPRDLNAVAIVGSRKCSLYGREQADRFGSLLGAAGFTVLSGGARGIDSAAHRGAMAHPEGRTIAVIGSGLDVVYPPENKHLFEQIAERGAVLSEYPLGTPPLATNFPKRNRIVSGMSRGVLVIEADVRSGALITARQANEEHGRVVFALPGKVDSPQSAGPHQLIRDGATLVTSLQDIIDDLPPLTDALPPSAATFVEPTRSGESLFSASSSPPTPEPKAVVQLSPTQQRIVDALDGDEADVDTLAERSGLETFIVTRELTFLTLKGVIQRGAGQTFSRRK